MKDDLAIAPVVKELPVVKVKPRCAALLEAGLEAIRVLGL
jgi:hypothetical protein